MGAVADWRVFAFGPSQSSEVRPSPQFRFPRAAVQAVLQQNFRLMLATRGPAAVRSISEGDRGDYAHMPSAV